MANLDRGKSLYYDWSKNESSVDYHGLPEVSGTYSGSYPVSPTKSTSSHHVDNVPNEKNATSVIELTILSPTHLPPPPAYQSCDSLRTLERLEPLRSTHPLTPHVAERGEKGSEPQALPFWRKKRGIILIVVLSNLIIIAMISGGIFISRDAASRSTGSKDMTTTTEGYTSSTSVTSTVLPTATIMSASPYQWGPSSDGTQASGNVVDSGNTESNSDAGGESKGSSGPSNKPGGGVR